MGVDDEKWLEWRAGGLGASDVAAAWTRSYGKTPFSVVAAKLGRIETVVDEDTQAIFDRGHEAEPLIAALVEDLLGLHVAGEQTWLEHPEQSWMRATVDGFLLRNETDMLNAAAGILESKTSGEHARLNWPYYETQVQWQMMVSGLPLAVVAVLKTLESGRTLYVREYEADYKLQSDLAFFAGEMWQHIEAGTLPSPETLDEVRNLHPRNTDDEAVELNPTFVGELRHAENVAAEAHTRLEGLKAELAERIGDHTTAVCDGVEVATWKAQTSKRFDQKAFAADNPELVEKYRTESESRVLRIKKVPQ